MSEKSAKSDKKNIKTEYIFEYILNSLNVLRGVIKGYYYLIK